MDNIRTNSQDNSNSNRKVGLTWLPNFSMSIPRDRQRDRLYTDFVNYDVHPELLDEVLKKDGSVYWEEHIEMLNKDNAQWFYGLLQRNFPKLYTSIKSFKEYNETPTGKMIKIGDDNYNELILFIRK